MGTSTGSRYGGGEASPCFTHQTAVDASEGSSRNPRRAPATGPILLRAVAPVQRLAVDGSNAAAE